MSSTDCESCKGYLYKIQIPIGDLKAIKITLAFFITLQCFYVCYKTIQIIEKLFVLRIQTMQIICMI